MTTQPDPLAIINCALSPSMQFNITSQDHPDPKLRRGIDFACIEAAIAAAEGLVATLGPDQPVPGAQGATPAGLLINLRGVAAQAEPYRSKGKRT